MALSLAVGNVIVYLQTLRDPSCSEVRETYDAEYRCDALEPAFPPSTPTGFALYRALYHVSLAHSHLHAMITQRNVGQGSQPLYANDRILTRCSRSLIL